MTTFHSLTVAKVEPETRDAVTITFAIPDALRNAYAFRPGQHLTLKARLGGEELRRCYSICRSRSPGEISVAVKAIDGGRFSRYAQSDIQQGMALDVMVPQGHFGYQPQAGRCADYGDCRRLRHYADDGDYRRHPRHRSRQPLHAGLRQPQQPQHDVPSGAGRPERPLSAASAGGTPVQPESMDSDLLQGRINGDKLRELAAHLLDFSRFEHAFICGPAAMMDEAEIALRELGVPETRFIWNV